MLYTEYLKTNTACPFCEPITNRIIKRGENAFLTYALAPYHKHHLMVVHYRHIENFKELNADETKSIEKLLHTGIDILESLGYADYTILLRNGDATGKSIKHIHYHIVPSVLIGDLDHKGEERKVMTTEEIDSFMNQVTKII